MRTYYRPTGINNFHGSDGLNLRVSGEKWTESGGLDLYLISKGQARKIERHFCGISGCRCAAGSAIQLDQDGNEWGIPVKYCD